MAIRKSKPVLAGFIMVFLFSKDNALVVGTSDELSKHRGGIYHIKSFKMTYLFKARDFSILYL